MNSLHIKHRSIITLKSLFFVAHLIVASFSFAAEQSAANNFFTAPLTKLSTSHAAPHIVIVKDAHGRKFILKHNIKSLEAAIHETLGAKIGIDANININAVKIIPSYDKSIQDIDDFPTWFQTLTKTLHTIVPGRVVDDIHSTMPYMVDIRMALVDNQNLKSLTHHKDLCKIAALDIFTSNWDRHPNNLLFAKNTNQFHAIDMDWMFHEIYEFPNDNGILSSLYNWIKPAQNNTSDFQPKYLLAPRVYKFLQTLHSEQLSYKEVKALQRVNNKLTNLQTIYPPEKLHKAWMDIAQEVQYTYDPRKQKIIRSLLEHNRNEVAKVQTQLTQLTAKDNIATPVRIRQNLKQHPFVYHAAKRALRNPLFEETLWQL